MVGHYDVLGIARTASNLEIRSAYRKGALQTHPDPQLKFFLGWQSSQTYGTWHARHMQDVLARIRVETQRSSRKS